jgi:hypothetical protein
MSRQSLWSSADDGSRLGQGAAAATAALAVVSAVVGVTTPPRSGPMCRLPVCVTAPYTDVAAFVPRDYLWLYPSIVLQLVFVVLVAVLTGRTAGERPVPALAAMGFALLGAGLLVADYGLQLFVVQPSLLAGQTDGLSLLSQYNPHGVFIGLENLGYAAIAIGWVFLGVTLAGRSALMRFVRWVFLTGGVLTWGFLVGLTVGYGAGLEYRFELAAITLYWLVALTAGVLLTVDFRRGSRPPTVTPTPS